MRSVGLWPFTFLSKPSKTHKKHAHTHLAVRTESESEREREGDVDCGLRSGDDGAVSSDDELSGVETDVQDSQTKAEDRELKETLLRKYGNHISSLKLEFSKKKKKGKLPKEARQILLEWWNVHYKWPYPTEADKISLAESTGLDQKQINNWFINQRKRHWKPSENMQLAVMDSLSGQFFADD
ncbi:unnamed protein product [Coffea canephora]|uniref:Homeobox domain-containing protein n=1 Tax=Coffea canephora TaxID=49390 RepID=A0A068UY52_COFCA|nr:unnamed protein product [Coffea canephora]